MIGASYAGERLHRPEPWCVEVPHATVEWSASFPAPASALRGAVVAQLGEEAHVDYHNHLEDGERRQLPATVCYRVVDGRPVVYVYGPRAADHAAELGRLRHLELRSGRVHLRSASLHCSVARVQLTPKRWRRYRLVSPLYPSSVACARRPGPGDERIAWAEYALTSSIQQLFDLIELEERNHRPHVRLLSMRDRRLRYKETRNGGFVGEFLFNGSLPPGIGIGAHRSVGFGWIEPCP